MYSTPIHTDHNLTYTLHITYCLKVNKYKQGENATLRYTAINLTCTDSSSAIIFLTKIKLNNTIITNRYAAL